MIKSNEYVIKEIKKDKILTRIFSLLKDYDCYLVGGYIRDLFLGKKSDDRDLIVHKKYAKKAALKIADILKGHFVPLDEENKIYRVVLADKKNYFDISGMLEDNLEADIKRRDLTINAIVYSPKTSEFIDIAHGIEDIKNKKLDVISLDNFLDDSLRMLRVYRFKAILGYEISDKIKSFIKEHVNLILNVSKERINQELMKLFDGDFTSEALLELDEAGLIDVLFPIMKDVKTIPPNTHHHLPLFYHLIETVKQIDIKAKGNKELNFLREIYLGNCSRLSLIKFAGFFHDIGKPSVWTIEEDTGRHRFIKHDEIGAELIKGIMKEYKFSKKQINMVENLIRYHIYPSALCATENTEKARMKFYRKLDEFVPDVIVLAMSDRLSARGEAVSEKMVNDNLNNLQKLLEGYFENLSKIELPEPFLNGNELSNLTGIPQSKELGDLLKEIYQSQLDGFVTSKDEAKNLALSLLNRVI